MTGVYLDAGTAVIPNYIGKKQTTGVYSDPGTTANPDHIGKKKNPQQNICRQPH